MQVAALGVCQAEAEAERLRVKAVTDAITRQHGSRRRGSVKGGAAAAGALAGSGSDPTPISPSSSVSPPPQRPPASTLGAVADAAAGAPSAEDDGKRKRPIKRLAFASDALEASDPEEDDEEEVPPNEEGEFWERGSLRSWGGSSLRSSDDGNEHEDAAAAGADGGADALKVLHLKTLCGLKHDQPHATFKDLTASCARLLAADIVTSTSVTQLNLAGNSLGLEGGKAIAMGIRANVRLAARLAAPRSASQRLAAPRSASPRASSARQSAPRRLRVERARTFDTPPLNCMPHQVSLVEVNVDGFPLPILQLKGLEASPNNKLDFSSKKLGQASAILIASVIGAEASATNALRVLNLRNNDIDDIGLSALSDAVADGAMVWLERLFLNKNQIGNAGLTAFAEAVKSKRLAMLKELGISLNRIGDPGLLAMTSVIKGGNLPCLTAIEVFPNPASSDAQEGLMHLVNKKKRPPRLSPRKSHLGAGGLGLGSHRSGTQASSHRSGSSG